MKKNALIVAAIMSLVITACENMSTSGETELHAIQRVMFSVDPIKADCEESLTKTVIDPADYSIKWSAQDTVGIYPTSGSQVYFIVPDGSTAASASFDGGGWEFKHGQTYRAYYPYFGDAYLDARNIKVNYTGQKQIGNNNSECLGNYIATYTSATSASSGNLSFAFHHLNTYLRLVANLPAGNYGKLTIRTDDNLFVEQGTYDLTSDNPVVIAEHKSNTIEMDLEIEMLQQGDVIIFVSCAPVNLSGRQLTISIVGQNGPYTYTYNPSKNYVAGSIYTLRASTVLYPEMRDIVFADESVKDLCLANWDSDGNGSVSYAEAAAVHDLGTVFMGQGITSFDELRFFTGLTSIGANAFSNCTGLISISIPANVSSIGANAFSNCQALTSIKLEPTVPPVLGSNALSTGAGIVVLVPENGYDTYLNATGWKDVATSIFASSFTRGYVDLGLSVKWAICNIGGSEQEELGNTYAWGSFMPRKSGATETNSMNNPIYYHGAEEQLPTNRDIASVAFGDAWRIPSIDEWNELRDNTTWEHITSNKVQGMLVTSRVNGNSIFIPDASYWSRDNMSSGTTNARYAIINTTSPNYINYSYHQRYQCKYIRPVME